jgi:hypothetical protein
VELRAVVVEPTTDEAASLESEVNEVLAHWTRSGWSLHGQSMTTTPNDALAVLLIFSRDTIDQR